MAWYRSGAVSVTNGSAVITGTGTAWVANVQPGHAINLPDGKVYEVLSVDSNTQITLGSAYLGGSAGGQAYSVQPNQGFAQSAATRLSDFLSQIQNWVTGALAGRFGDGSAAAPAMSFAADQDTGLRRAGDNTLALVTGGADRIIIDSGGLATFNGGLRPGASAPLSSGVGGGTISYEHPITRFYIGDGTGYSMRFCKRSGGATTDLITIDDAGNLLVGTNSGSSHLLAKATPEGGAVLTLVAATSGTRVAQFNGTSQEGFNGARAALWLGKDSTTNRSGGFAGTINASGADYAEYMTKADGCGTIAKGDVCGVDRDGRLCRTWADAVRFVIKSTDPNLVGGDTWATHLPPRPDAPGAAPIEPNAPIPSAGQVPEQPVRGEDEDEEAFIHRRVDYLIALSAATAAATADQDAMTAYLAAAAAYPAAKAEHDAAVASYEAALASWEADLETARRTVDRIAFSGQVPVNVDTDTLAACEAALAAGQAVYLVAVARGAGIGATAVSEADMTLPLYMRRLGAVWAIRDGRPWVDVQHG